MTEAALNSFQPPVGFHIETSHFFCTANQMAGFYMKQRWTEMVNRCSIKTVIRKVFPVSFAKCFRIPFFTDHRRVTASVVNLHMFLLAILNNISICIYLFRNYFQYTSVIILHSAIYNFNNI